jgi:hypothetical protein
VPPDAAIRPWIAPRLVHLHFFEDPWSDHDVDGHAALNRWGLGAALGFDFGF